MVSGASADSDASTARARWPSASVQTRLPAGPAAVSTEFAIGTGRTEGDPWLDDVLQPEDVAAAVVTVLQQPRRMRTTLWSMWSMAQSS